MPNKKLLLHYNFMKDILDTDPMSILKLYELMAKEFGVNYQYVRREVKELIALKKIIEVKHNNEIMLLWTKEKLKFEYELSNNIMTLGKQFVEFHTIPSCVHQMRLPQYVLKELRKQNVKTENIELMLEIKAIKSNEVGYKINKE